MKKRDEALPGLDLEEVLHPIWTQPNHDQSDEPEYIRDLYWKLWSSMQPFDGRPDSKSVVRYAQNVWALLALESAHQDPFWLVGQIVRTRMEACSAAPQASLPVIRRLCQEYIDTIVGAL